MGITERREREKEEVRNKILDAARDLFAREGYEAVTMRRIAEAIEYSPTTIYNHFEDKDDLVRCLCDGDFGQLLSALQTQPVPADPVVWIRQLGLAYTRFALSFPNHYRFMFMTAPDIEVHEDHESFPGHLAFGVLRRAVAGAVEGGRFRAGSVDTMALHLWIALHGAISLLITMRPEHWPVPVPPDLVEQVLENSIRGFLREPPPQEKR
ncbi:MAG TPA: TetR/AcrR family transcriptional regulator [Vicinamibacteria bacterium]|nr:TetR/AcrR family transcriptional regulator [Vicinamibacteria bacterium]